MPDGFGLIYETTEGDFEITRKAKRAKGFAVSTNTAMTLMIKRQVPIQRDTYLDD